MHLSNFPRPALLQHWRHNVDLFSQIFHVSPDSYLTHYNFGVVLQEQGDCTNAIHHFHEAIRSHPKYAKAYDLLVSTYVLQGRMEEGEWYLREASRLDQNNPQIQRNLADVLTKRKKYVEAVGLYRELIQEAPNNEGFYNNYGIALVGQGQLNEAITCFENAFRLNPNFSEAKNNRDIVKKLVRKKILDPNTSKPIIGVDG